MNAPLELLSAHDVAARFGVVERTVKRWIDAGLLEPVKIDHGAYIFTAETIAAFERPKRGGARQRRTQSTMLPLDEGGPRS
jgi:predicted site-specific integrase-resolvase